MERFIFVVAIACAIVFGVVAMVGGGRHFHFEMDGARSDPVMAVAAGRAPARVFAGDELQFKHIAAHVTITPEDRQDISIEIDNPGHVPMPDISVDGDRIVVNGHLAGRVSHCSQDGADVRGYASVSLAEMPQIVVRAPRALSVAYAGAGLAEIGPTQSLDIDFSGCGSATAGDVAGELKVDLAGSGQVRAGAARSLNADIAGSGDIVTGAIAEGASIDIGGSGTVTIATLGGSLNADSAGSGSVTVNGGAVTTAELDLAGSGGVTVTAPIQRLKVSILGSGDVNVHGVVGDLDASVAGSGGVHATSVTGAVHREILGSGNVSTGP